jgi:hypothetical protein
MSTLVRWIPRLITAAAVLHVLSGLTNVDVFRDIARAGFIDSIAGHDDRAVIFWFVAMGTVLIALGEFARWAVRETGHLPARLGWWLLGIAAVVIVVMPYSGAWLYAAIGVLAVLGSRRDRGPTTAPQAPVATRTTT